MKRRSDIEAQLNHILTMAGQLLNDYGPALERCRYAARDGYPSNSGPSGGTTGSGVSDPVGEMATNPAMSDPVRRRGIQMRKGIQRSAELISEAYRQLSVADGARAYLTTPPEVERGRVSTVPDCYNCKQPIEDKVRAGRCDTCYRYHKRTGEDRKVA